MEDVIRKVHKQKGIEKLPMVLQSEAAECGLACLVMILNAHGNNLTLTDMRGQNPVSLSGVTLLSLMRDATRFGLTPRALKLDLDELEQLQTPCVLHWDMQHFVVLKEVSKGIVTVHDPAAGVLKLPLAEVGKHFTGIALEASPNVKFIQSKGRRKRVTLAGVLGQVGGLKWAWLHVLALSVAIEGFFVAAPLFMQWVLDQVLLTGDRDLLVLIGVGFAFLTIFRSSITALRSWSITWIGANLNSQWEGNLFRHLLSLPATFFEKRHVGDIASRFTSVKAIQNVLSTQFIGTVLDGVMSVVTVALMFAYSVPLSVLTVAALGCYIVLRWRFYLPLWTANGEKIIQSAKQQSNLLEALRGIRSLQLSNQHASRTSDYANHLNATINKDVAAQRLQIWFDLGNALIFGLCRIVVIWYGAVLVMNRDLTVGMLVSFVAYADQLSSRGANFVNNLYEIRLLGIHAERISEVSFAKPELGLYPEKPVVPLDSSIQVKNLSFRYSKDEPWVIKDLSFKIGDGECVAVTGPSGSGKSTLVKLLLGLLEPTEGQVLFGGVEIAKIGKANFRSMVSAVLQDDTLFAGSISQNISFFDPDARQEDIERCAGMAQIHDDIINMPMRYNTIVGDMGSTLSGGQKQRVIIARSLYRKPRLLVLDEATSHLDVPCEHRFNDVVSKLKLTRIIIAHRQDTIASASRVIQLDIDHNTSPEHAEAEIDVELKSALA